MADFNLSVLTEEQRNVLASFGASVLNIVGLEGGMRTINNALCELMTEPNKELSELTIFLLEMQKYRFKANGGIALSRSPFSVLGRITSGSIG